MRNSRRDFFARLRTGALLASFFSIPVAAKAVLNSKFAGAAAQNLDLAAGSLTMILRISFPTGRSEAQIHADLNSCTDQKKIDSLHGEFFAAGLMTPAHGYTMQSNYFEVRHEFENQRAYLAYTNRIDAEKMVDHQRQRDLGYRIETRFI